MASLNHVCMWSEDGWKPITAEEASRLHPGGTVSAYSGLFMCELCGQYVLLTGGDYQVRHFRHSSNEKSKDCPERTFGDFYLHYDAKEHELPIRIVDITSDSFRFELGLLRIPEEMLNEKSKIVISSPWNDEVNFVYTKERLNNKGITYVSIGEKPFQEYTLKIRNANPKYSKKIHDYWPGEITGIDSYGTLFESDSGRKLISDADVELGKEYFFVTNRKIYSNLDSMDISYKKISEKKISLYSSLYVYSITANSMNENAAKFFLEYHHRLTEKAVNIQPIWPPYLEESFLIKHNQESIWLHIKGNINTLKSFPETGVSKLLNGNLSKLYKFDCENRQQLISVGRVNTLKYTYFWREPITCNYDKLDFTVHDVDGNLVLSGETNKKPKKGVLIIQCDYDGELEVRKNGFICEKRKISAGRITEIQDLSLGKSLALYIGLDCVWRLELKRELKNMVDNKVLFLTLSNSKGNLIHAPHSLKNIAISYQGCDDLYKWIIKCIKEDEICEDAFEKLKKAYVQDKQKL